MGVIPIKKQSFPIEVKSFIILLLYSIIGLIITMLLQYVFSLFHNPIVKWLYWRSDAIYILYLIVGLSYIFYYYWKKPWDCLKSVLSSLLFRIKSKPFGSVGVQIKSISILVLNKIFVDLIPPLQFSPQI